MGFQLSCYFTLDAGVLPLFERVIPGGSRFVIPVGGDGLPAGWVLPTPWRLEYDLGGTPAMAGDVVDDAAVDAWRKAAGVPGTPDPLDAFDDLDLQLASLLSLAAPSGVVVIDDDTFGGLRFNEYAAVCVSGRLRAAGGIDFADGGRGAGRAFELRDGAYHPVTPAEADPVTRCAAVLDRRFAGVSLFEGYLPRNAEPGFHRDRLPPADGPLRLPPGTVEEWGPYFPLLTRHHGG
ncbi:hypothetical protein FHS43_000908 [Streptosporangium becharense]|uniref:Uncharacterized protein n=1 Tax=Streptosporangium becharense TaxID=1816182 RepID=A0A7W9IET7_9ACTN|nr:hypothetical protein [Streptosporangium becharense]MBB2909662.1 hypothetical protein [Streptosporangium becharense]MBB5819382.1 hypothetical protein [Streptosporangium becharense]